MTNTEQATIKTYNAMFDEIIYGPGGKAAYEAKRAIEIAEKEAKMHPIMQYQEQYIDLLCDSGSMCIILTHLRTEYIEKVLREFDLYDLFGITGWNVVPGIYSETQIYMDDDNTHLILDCGDGEDHTYSIEINKILTTKL